MSDKSVKRVFRRAEQGKKNRYGERADMSLPKENEANKAEGGKKFYVNRFLLFFYDVIILFAACFVLLFADGGSELCKNTEFFVHFAAACVPVFGFRLIFKTYRQVWRYGGVQSYLRLLIADVCAAMALIVAERFLPFTTHVSAARVLATVGSSLVCALGIRMWYRYAYKCCENDNNLAKILQAIVKAATFNQVKLKEVNVSPNRINVAIIGTGRTATGLAEEFIGNKRLDYSPRLFIGEKSDKTGRQIYNIPVVRESGVTKRLLDKHDIKCVIAAVPTLAAERKKSIYEKFKQLGCDVKVYDYPVIRQVGEQKRLLREFDIEELLFRKPVYVNDDATCAYYKGKVVLITGGGGSIGSELCRQIAKMQPKTLIILDVYENGAYEVQQELKLTYGDALDVRVEIFSVCDRAALEKVFAAYRPNVVLNAAAHKHVPLMEHNCCEAIKNNVFGTLNSVELAEKYRAERFMMVSTDKAVNPTNVMGATKRMCEMIVQCHSKTSDYTTYSATRFGNVLGSAGSVIPLFKRQIKSGGPLTLTDKRIIRYFMTIQEASQLVLQSGAMAKNGELFVLDMGKPVKILDLAENMIRLSGLEPYKDIDIIETGLRPGEKLYEELLVKTEQLGKTDNDMIFVEKDTPVTPEKLNERLEKLRIAAESGDDDLAKETLHKVVPTYVAPEIINAEAIRTERLKEAAGE